MRIPSPQKIWNLSIFAETALGLQNDFAGWEWQ